MVIFCTKDAQKLTKIENRSMPLHPMHMDRVHYANVVCVCRVITYRMPSKPSSEPFIVKTGARAYALATRRLRSNTITLAHISSSI